MAENILKIFLFLALINITTSCRPNLQTCSPSSCFHSTTCSSPFINEIQCNCNEASTTFKLGPRCQWLKRKFMPTAEYQYFPMDMPTFKAGCPVWHISFEYFNSKVAQNATLLYIGPASLTDPAERILAVQLSSNEPELVLGASEMPQSIGNKAQEQIKWHRIDLIALPTAHNPNVYRTTLMQNLCAFPLDKEKDGNRCSLSHFVPANFFTNPNLRMYLGGRPSLGATTMQKASFQGCIKNFRIHSELKSLYSTDAGLQSENDCDIETNSCVKPDCGQGLCEGPVDNHMAGICNCNLGFLKADKTSRCVTSTRPIALGPNNGVEWVMQAAVDWEHRRAPNGRSLLPLGFRYRTLQTDGVLVTLVGWTDPPRRQVVITISVRSSVLTSSYRLTSPDAVYGLNLSSTVNASDGRWHEVRFTRSGPTLSLRMDHGEAQNYAFLLPEPPLTSDDLGQINSISFVKVGNKAYDGAVSLGVDRANNFTGCLDDIRIFEGTYSLSDPGVSTDLDKQNPPPCREPCDGYLCPKTEQCVSVGTKAFCRPIFNCNLKGGNLCENGGTCYWNAGRLSYMCTCPPGYLGERCETAVAIAGFPWWWIVVGILLLLLLILLLLLLYYCCCPLLCCVGAGKKEKASTQAELDTPPEKLGEYKSTGPGEVDYVGPIDLNYLVINPQHDYGRHTQHLHPITIPDGGKPPSTMVQLKLPGDGGGPLPMIDTSMPLSMNAKMDPELDYPLEYAYEGRIGSPLPSLSSIVVTEPEVDIHYHHDIDEPMEIPPMGEWGPQFHPITTIYTTDVVTKRI